MNGIVSRLQVFLAKIAGKDVDVSTLTPPVAINEEERLMLDIADRIDAIEESGGGGGGGILWCTYSGDDNTGYGIDKSFNELKAAVENGMLLVMVMDTASDISADHPDATDIWAREYFYIKDLVQYLNSDGEPLYFAYFGDGGWEFASTDADADMVET